MQTAGETVYLGVVTAGAGGVIRLVDPGGGRFLVVARLVAGGAVDARLSMRGFEPIAFDIGAAMSRGRVSRGTMTASTYPRAAAA